LHHGKFSRDAQRACFDLLDKALAARRGYTERHAAVERIAHSTVTPSRTRVCCVALAVGKAEGSGMAATTNLIVTKIELK